MRTEEGFRQMDQQIERVLVSHAENLKQWIEAGCCPRCHKHHLVEINPQNITFRCCSSECGWFAIYPIQTVGNSECFIPPSEPVLRAALLDVIDGGDPACDCDVTQWHFFLSDEAESNAARLAFCDKVVTRVAKYKSSSVIKER